MTGTEQVLVAQAVAAAVSGPNTLLYSPNSSSGLNFAYYGGYIGTFAGAPLLVAAGTVALTDNATNYVECSAGGTVSANTSAFTAGRIPVAIAVTAASKIIAYADRRPMAYAIPASILDYVPKPSISVGAEAADNVDCTIQIKNTNDANVAALHLVTWWLADSATGGISSTTPTDVSVTTGTAIDAVGAVKSGRVMTNASGTAVIRVNYTGANTWYLLTAVNGRVVASAALTFT